MSRAARVGASGRGLGRPGLTVLLLCTLAAPLAARAQPSSSYRIDPEDLVTEQNANDADSPENPWATKDESRESDPPELHVSLSPDLKPGQMTLSVRIVDASDVLVATLYRRAVGAPAWTITNLTSDNGLFNAQFRVDGDFEYYVEAFDAWGNGPGLAGSSEAPRLVSMKSGGKAPVKKAPPPVVRKPPRPKKPPEPPPPPMPSARVHRVATARAIIPGRFELALSGAYLTGDDFLSPGARLSGVQGETRLRWGATPFAEVTAAARGRRATLSMGPVTRTAGAFGDLSLGGRVLSPALGDFRLALHLEADLHLPGDASAFAASTEALVAATWTPSTAPVRVSAHAGYRWDNSENTVPGRWSSFGAFGMDLSRFDQVRLGLAAEFQWHRWVPFVEYSLDVPVDRRTLASCEGEPDACRTPPPAFPAAAREVPQRLSAGVRLELAKQLAVVFAGELSLTPAGRNLSAADARAWPAPGSFALPAPFALHAGVRWQFGAPLPDPVATLVTPKAPVSEPEPVPAVAPSEARPAVIREVDEPKAPAASPMPIEATPPVNVPGKQAKTPAAAPAQTPVSEPAPLAPAASIPFLAAPANPDFVETPSTAPSSRLWDEDQDEPQAQPPAEPPADAATAADAVSSDDAAPPDPAAVETSP